MVAESGGGGEARRVPHPARAGSSACDPLRRCCGALRRRLARPRAARTAGERRWALRARAAAPEAAPGTSHPPSDAPWRRGRPARVPTRRLPALRQPSRAAAEAAGAKTPPQRQAMPWTPPAARMPRQRRLAHAAAAHAAQAALATGRNARSIPTRGFGSALCRCASAGAHHRFVVPRHFGGQPQVPHSAQLLHGRGRAERAAQAYRRRWARSRSATAQRPAGCGTRAAH